MPNKILFILSLLLVIALFMYQSDDVHNHNNSIPTSPKNQQQTPTRSPLLINMAVNTAPTQKSKTAVFCPELEQLKRNLKRDKASYLLHGALFALSQGNSLQNINQALLAGYEFKDVNKVMRVLYLIPQSLIALDEKASTLMLFNEFISSPNNRKPTERWYKDAKKSKELTYYESEIATYPEIAFAISQESVREMTIRNDHQVFNSLLLYQQHYDVQLANLNLLSDPQFIYNLKDLRAQQRYEILSFLVSFEALTEQQAERFLNAIAIFNDPQLNDLIHHINQADIIESDENTLLTDFFDNLATINKEDHHALCQLYQKSENLTQITVSDYQLTSEQHHPQCEIDQFGHIPFLTIYNRLALLMASMDMQIDDAQSIESITTEQLASLKEAFYEFDDTAREFAFILFLNKVNRNKLPQLIEKLIETDFYPKNSNAVILFNHLSFEQALKLLPQLDDIDEANHRDESVIYNLMFMQSELTIELIKRGYTLKHNPQSPDPLLKLLHYLPQDRDFSLYLDMIRAILEQGFELNPMHQSELRRMQLNSPDKYQALIEQLPELVNATAETLTIYQCA